MKHWGKITERGCYTLTKPLKPKLQKVARETEMGESEVVRNALNLYFQHLNFKPPTTKVNPELRD